jgi:hypothetical protein
MIQKILQPPDDVNKIVMKDICETFKFLRRRTSCLDCGNKICFRCVNCGYCVCNKCGINLDYNWKYDYILQKHFNLECDEIIEVYHKKDYTIYH